MMKGMWLCKTCHNRVNYYELLKNLSDFKEKYEQIKKERNICQH